MRLTLDIKLPRIRPNLCDLTSTPAHPPRSCAAMPAQRPGCDARAVCLLELVDTTPCSFALLSLSESRVANAVCSRRSLPESQ